MELTDPASISAFAQAFIDRQEPLNLLILNAGIMAPPLFRDAEGREGQFATNHLGHFRLTAALWPALKAAGSARVVVLSSRGHLLPGFDLTAAAVQQQRQADLCLPGQPERRPRPLCAAPCANLWRSGRCSDADPAHAGSLHGGGSGVQKGWRGQARATKTRVTMHSNQAGHPLERAAECCAFFFLECRERLGYDDRTSPRPLAIITATARPGLLSQGSHVAPSPQRRIPCKRHETELTYCPVYGFKPRVICTKGLTPALFCRRAAPRQKSAPSGGSAAA